MDRLNIKSIFLLLIISLFIQLNYQKLSFDFFLLKKGLSYIFYFSVGFAFESVREQFESINKKNLCFVFVLLTLLIFIDYKNLLFYSFPTIFIRSFWIFVLGLFSDKFLTKIYETKILKLVIRNLFNIYLFHDPLEYLVLRLFFNGRFEIYKSSLGVIFYYAVRTIGVIVFSIILGEFVRMILNSFKRNC